MHQTTERKSWTFLAAPTELPTGQHRFPFSVRLEGSHPASVDMPLGSMSYHLKAVAIVPDNKNRTSCYPTKLEQTIVVKRSIPEELVDSRTGWHVTHACIIRIMRCAFLARCSDGNEFYWLVAAVHSL